MTVDELIAMLLKLKQPYATVSLVVGGRSAPVVGVSMEAKGTNVPFVVLIKGKP